MLNVKPLRVLFNFFFFIFVCRAGAQLCFGYAANNSGGNNNKWTVDDCMNHAYMGLHIKCYIVDLLIGALALF